MDRENAPHSGFSRRRFLQGAAVTGTALAGQPQRARGQQDPDAGVRDGLHHYDSTGTEISLRVNGTSSRLHVCPSTTLLEVLRETLGMTGAKEVCGRGACGACTVLVDGLSINSCMMLAIDAVGREVTTVEGLVKDGQLDPIQQAFADHDACQCGYCIPGFVVRSRALLDESPVLDREQIKHGLCGNICRCAAYVRILDAVEAAATRGQV